MRRRTLLSLLAPALLAGAATTSSAADPATAATQAKVLVYTRNHVTNVKGYVHDNIAASVAALKEICTPLGITAEASDDPSAFTPANLANYRAVIFCNSNNEAFATPEQSKAFTAYVENGGGFIGIHSASGSERTNPDFKRILGGTFKWHPPHQTFTVHVTDASHPSNLHLPAQFQWKDEAYLCDLIPNLHILLELDTQSITNPTRDKWQVKVDAPRFPLAWCHQVGKGRCFYSALGHDKEAYRNPILRKHIEGGIQWVLNPSK